MEDQGGGEEKGREKRRRDERQGETRPAGVLLIPGGKAAGQVQEAGRKNRHRGMQMAASGSICKGRNICTAHTVEYCVKAKAGLDSPTFHPEEEVRLVERGGRNIGAGRRGGGEK